MLTSLLPSAPGRLVAACPRQDHFGISSRGLCCCRMRSNMPSTVPGCRASAVSSCAQCVPP